MTEERPSRPTPEVVVVVPTLNGSRHISDQLKSLLTQRTATPWELIVADGGSTDGTVDLVKSHATPEFPLTVVELTGSPGINAGINAGVRASLAPKVLIAEQDDVVDPDWLEALRLALDLEVLVGSRICKEKLNRSELVACRRHFAEDLPGGTAMVDSTGMGFRRSLWDQLGGFDETYTYGGNDAEFCFRAYSLGFSAVRINDAVVNYRLREEVNESFRQARAYGRSSVRIHKQFGPELYPRRSVRAAAIEVARLGYWGMRALVSVRYRYLVAYRGGLQLGQIEGSLRYRCFFP
jgi:GT2 family glycosyltransferase